MRLDLLILGDTLDAWRAAETASRLGRKVVVLRPDADGRGTAVGIAALLRRADDEPATVSPQTAPRDLWHDALRSHEQAVACSCREHGIRSWRGVARLTGPQTAELHIDGVRVRFDADRILVATGTTARRPRGLAIDRRTVLTPEDISNLRATPPRLVVLGGNPTARASARFFAAAGSTVVVVDAPSSGSLEPAVASRLRVVAGDVLGLRRDAESVAVRLTDGRDLSADAVLFAADRPGATVDLGLDAAGLELDEDGRLWCDETGRTWVPTIAAAGEVVGYPRWLRDGDATPAIVESLCDAVTTPRRRPALAG